MAYPCCPVAAHMASCAARCCVRLNEYQGCVLPSALCSASQTGTEALKTGAAIFPAHTCGVGTAIMPVCLKQPDPVLCSLLWRVPRTTRAHASSAGILFSAEYGAQRSIRAQAAQSDASANDVGQAFQGTPVSKTSVLVVGGTGTLGRQVVRRAIDVGYDVRCIVRPRPVPADFLRDWGATTVQVHMLITADIRIKDVL